MDKLTAIIERALSRGWDMFGHSVKSVIPKKMEYSVKEYHGHILLDINYPERDITDNDTYCLAEIIFNHDFAKAYWGEELVIGNPLDHNIYDQTPKYLWELVRLALRDTDQDRIAYLFNTIAEQEGK